jgi:hypothetical protein
LPGLTFAVLDFQRAKLVSEKALTPLDLAFDARGDVNEVDGECKRTLFDDHHVGKLIRIFDDMLRAIVKDPNQVISDVQSNT